MPYHSSFTRLSGTVMKNCYSIEEERMIAERSKLIVRGLTYTVKA
jgi:hypothetical protein